MEKPFSGQSILIVGASSGIGRCIALQLADQGANLILASRDADNLELVKSNCASRGSSAMVIPTDVTDRQNCQNLITRTIQENGKLDMLVYSAGIGMRADFEKVDNFEVFEKVMRVNFWGCINCVYYALPYLKASQGRLVVLASLGAKFPTPHATFYSASKHAVAGFCDTLRIEEADATVSVTVVYPEWVETGISARALDQRGSPVGSMIRQEKGSMSAEKCASRVIKAAVNREREVIWLHGRVGMWLELISPSALDQIAIHTFSE